MIWEVGTAWSMEEDEGVRPRGGMWVRAIVTPMQGAGDARRRAVKSKTKEEVTA